MDGDPGNEEPETVAWSYEGFTGWKNRGKDEL